MQKNIYKLMLAMVVVCFSSYASLAQLSFRNANAKLTSPHIHSSGCVTVCDWNDDGLDDIIKLEDGHDAWVEVQVTNGQFTRIHLADVGTGSGWSWGMTVADIDHNGYKDIVCGGYSEGYVIMTNNTGTGATVTQLASSNFFWQNITCGDFNNDGWIDVFACDDDAAAHLYMNNGTGSLAPSTFINFDINPTINYAGDPADSGNYGSSWIDFDNDGDLDLFIAHCRQASGSFTDLRRKDRLFVNDGSNNFTEQSANFGIEATAYNQTWTGSFADIDNDGDLDLMLANHDVSTLMLLNDGTGHYTDISAAAGVDLVNIVPLEAVLEDFDNDGYVDVLATGNDFMYYKNNGDGTFTQITNLFDASNMQSFAIGDLNHDGFVDVYAGYATGYTSPSLVDDIIWLNNKNSNHFLTLQLEGTVSNHGAVGARATLYSALGTQIREVRSGESYATCNSFECHFGLGSLTSVDSVVVRFPSGISQTIITPDVDQFIKVIENDCVSPSSAITVNGPLLLCPGQSLTLTANPGHNYAWSDGSSAQVLSVTATGEYNVMVSDAGNNCSAISPNVEAVVNPDNTPVITVSAPVELCVGQSVTLNGPAGQGSYTWSDGSTTQNITVFLTNSYTLTVPGLCQPFTSAPINVTVHNTGINSVADDSACINGTAYLNATGVGGEIAWYDAATGGNLLYVGNPFPTPPVTGNTVYYAEDRFNTNYPVNFMPPNNNTMFGGGGYLNSTQRYLTFDVMKAMTLQSVRVYAQTAGNRTIELRDVNDNVLQSITANLPVGDSRVTLAFNIAPGTNYHLGVSTTTTVNLYRNNNNTGTVSYPINISGLVSITGSEAGIDYYYYFYDWEVHEQDVVCSSATRSPVSAFMDPGCVTSVATAANNNLLNIYPNPSAGLLNIELKYVAKEIAVTITDVTGKAVRGYSFNNESGAFNKSLLLTDLAKGFYMLNVKAAGQQWERKIAIQ